MHVALRSEQSLLFAGPQRDANGAARLDVERLQDAHGFHGDDGAGAVVGCAGAGDPAIEVAAEHDDLIFQLGIGAGNFGDGVEAVLVLAGEFGFDVDFDADGHVGLGEPIETAVALDRGHHHGNLDALVGEVGSAAEGGAVVVKECAAASRRRSCHRGWAQ